LNLYDPNWLIHTRSEERPPAKVLEGAAVSRSMISHGCVVHRATVEHSVLSPGVVVHEGAHIRHSIVMTDSVIGPGVTLDRVIVDKLVKVGANSHLGYGDDYTENLLEPNRLNTGITIVGRNATIPAGTRAGRNVLIGTDVTETDFRATEIPSGDTVDSRVVAVWI
jgi:glucose-1-phosphate adenylyltransferase